MFLFEKNCINQIMNGRMHIVHGCAPAHRRLAEALVEADQSAENFLAVRVQLLQLILYQRCILWRALLD